MIGLLQFSSAIISGFPGQTGNMVGFAAAPASAPSAFTAANGQTWPGAYSSLTAWPGGTGSQTISAGTHAQSGAGTSGNPYVFSYYDFDALTGSTTISISNAIFVGCRFQSNQTTNENVSITGSDVTLTYCSIVPRTALSPTIPNAAWPSSGAGQQILPDTGSYSSYTIPNANGYQYAITQPQTQMTIDHCDAWGFANFMDVKSGSTAQITIQNCWIHDCRNDNNSTDHSDGPGYLNGGTQPSNVSILNCTIASIGNTNALAFQGGTGNFNNLIISGNYLSGFGYNSFLSVGSGATGCQFTNNTFGTDLAWVFGTQHDDSSTIYTIANGNLWRNNKLYVLPGTSYIGSAGQTFTSANSGNYVLPNKVFSTTDWSS